jgi:hypothetical protein
MFSLIFECGMSTPGSNAAWALRIRASMSEIGSVIVFSCPRRLAIRDVRENLVVSVYCAGRAERAPNSFTNWLS